MISGDNCTPITVISVLVYICCVSRCVPSSDGRDEDVTEEVCIEGLGLCAEGDDGFET